MIEDMNEGSASLRDDGLYDVDLDADLSMTERAIVADTPFSSFVKVVCGVFIFFFLISLASLSYTNGRNARERALELKTKASEIESSAASATPMELVNLIDRWKSVFRMGTDVKTDLATSVQLPAQLHAAGVALVARGLSHLNRLEYLEPVEAAEIAVRLNDLARTPTYGLTSAVDVATLNGVLQRVVEYGTRVAVNLGSPVATAADLRRASGLLYRLAQLVEPGVAAEYAATADALLERAFALEYRNEAVDIAGDGEVGVARRQEFAASVFHALRKADLGISRVSAEGPGARILVIEGEAQSSDLVAVFLYEKDLRQRLVDLGFVRVQGVGTDGTQTYPL